MARTQSKEQSTQHVKKINFGLLYQRIVNYAIARYNLQIEKDELTQLIFDEYGMDNCRLTLDTMTGVTVDVVNAHERNTLKCDMDMLQRKYPQAFAECTYTETTDVRACVKLPEYRKMMKYL